MANETLNIQNGVSPITIDTEVTEGSMRPVTSDGIYKAIQAGGGGGGSSDVLNVTATLEGGNISYSHDADEVYNAFLAGKAIKMQMIKRGGSESYVYETLMYKDQQGLHFFPLTISQTDVPAPVLLSTSDPISWVYNPSVNCALVPLVSAPTTAGRVPMLSSDSQLYFNEIKRTLEFNGSIAQLIAGALGSAGTAIGTSITDPDALATAESVMISIGETLSAGRPVVIKDTFVAEYSLDVCGYSFYNSSIVTLICKTAEIVAGDLHDVTLCFHCSWNGDNALDQLDVAAYCDSHPITFM